VYLQGGYKTVTPIEVGNCIGAHNNAHISYKAVRVFFGCLALQASREAASRVARRHGRRTFTCRYRSQELCQLTGLREQVVKKELRALERSGLLSFKEVNIGINRKALDCCTTTIRAIAGRRSTNRPIPVPRSVLRFVARCSKPSVGKTILAYVVRGLTLERRGGGIKVAGTMKASWIANVFCLSLRSAKASRGSLIECGFISKDTGSFQRKLNRDGAYFQINAHWEGSRIFVSTFAPRCSKNASVFAPPYKDRKTSYEFKNQKARSGSLKPTGVCNANRNSKPKLGNIRPSDLKRYPTVKILFDEAVKWGWLIDSEANLLKWVGAAVRANTVKARDPVRVFMGIVKQKRWAYITQQQEDRAQKAIKASCKQ
jgi:hypothetical protein